MAAAVRVHLYQKPPEVRVGGNVPDEFSPFSGGALHSFGGECLELVPDQRLRYTDRFDDPNLPLGTLR